MLARVVTRVAPKHHHGLVGELETIQGVEFPTTPAVPDGVPLISDSSSDFLAMGMLLNVVAALELPDECVPKSGEAAA